MAPDVLKLFPYSFTSSLPAHSRVVTALNTKYGTATVLQPYMHAYYGGCRVREVNTTGIYIESSCEISTHWLQYGLMVQAPDNMPLCSTGGVCVRNYYNTEWEQISTVSSENSSYLFIYLNTVRSRYADTVAVSVLPGVVVAQILLMGVISLYQVMSHKRSVLLTQIWAYRCQNGRMQVLYLAQITYHLVYNSDLYWLGLATGTLTEESIANIACCFFAFSYSFVNLMRARSGNQQLDRNFRLTWEAMQVLITAAVVVLLEAVQHTPLVSIIQKNAQILRKSSASDTKYCGLNDSCILFTVNMEALCMVASVGVGAAALIASKLANKMSLCPRKKVGSAIVNVTRVQIKMSNRGVDFAEGGQLTSFEQNCLGTPFTKLFHDCDDIAYTTYNGKRCITVEGLLLAGYLYYGQHIYQASSVLLLVVSRVIPQKIIRTFNVLLLRWGMNPKTGVLTHALSCTWYTASGEDHKLAAAVPVA
ncbi:hypothetical protein PF010_g15131 [Phytophthora fragariae]|uniref:Uncharacterized protein n=2 Tax=Phytophthora fragariae TaxID=53985 RepID=A0A6A3PX63_9STRA|nr:hypothetical protein PF009_g24962 [Phytophthora fragariae]KAE9063888.1 hypothetical protein PF007_g29392 [Phytophthora fragariae]KAE9070882.1 hypothetical protein PF006_g29265 [Phytophthora fragariae]KAE9099600.1 hypothetical protein PF010_g15131 [Phytophthora fragariae]KAE9186564.1 hypothetical protein PF004_g23044 [Phytophthora fragariae]